MQKFSDLSLAPPYLWHAIYTKENKIYNNQVL